MPLPYDEILESRDRSWSRPLFERLISPDVSEDEMAELVWDFGMLADPRYEQSLTDVLTDLHYSDAIREAAGEVLRFIGWEADRDTLRAWWNSDDPILRLHALHSMGPDNADIIEQVASDPSHPLYANAISCMSFDFELPRHTALKIKALTHENPDVRERAANCLLWDEPVSAELPLIAVTYDPVAAVVESACNTLEYYPTQRAFRRVAQLRAHNDEKVRATAEKSYRAIREIFLRELKSPYKKVRKHIRGWLEPLWDELAFTRKELKRKKYSRKQLAKYKGGWPEKKGKKVSVKRTVKLLNDPDTSPLVIQKLFYPRDWRSVSAKKRKLLTSLFLGHLDPTVRAESTHAFRAWKDQDSLIRLLADGYFYPRKSAMYALGKTPPYRNRIAEIVWEYFQRPDAVSTYGSETLSTYHSHAKHKKAVPRFYALAQNRERSEALRGHAVMYLSPWDDQAELLALMPLLEEAPSLTWELHVELLEAAACMKFPVDIARFRGLDHLAIQVALAPFL